MYQLVYGLDSPLINASTRRWGASMRYSVMVGLLLMSSASLAQEPTPSSTLGGAEAGVESGTTLHGLLGTETIQYPTPIAGRSEFSSNNLLRAQVRLIKKSSQALIFTDLQMSKSMNINYQYIALSELYAGQPEGTHGFYFGRKKALWSQADQDWNLGLWQPLFQEDGLRQYQQGLMGLFYQGKSADIEFTALASPIFIPTLNADLVEKDGTLVSENRWMRSIPEQATVNGRDVKLIYRLKTPPYQELLAKPTLALRAHWKSPEHPERWAAISVARKPMNTLSIKYDAALVSRSVGFEGEAEVVPVVHMHDLVSLEAGFEAKSIRWSASLTADRPEKKSIENGFSEDGFQTDYYQQQPQPLQILVLKGETQVSAAGREIHITASYLKAQSSKTVDVDSEGQQQSDFVPYRLLYTNALGIHAQTQVNERWLIQLKYLRELDQSGSIWSGETSFLARPHVRLFAGFDFLGIDQVSAIETDNRFLNSYRHNDRVFGGFSYVF